MLRKKQFSLTKGVNSKKTKKFAEKELDDICFTNPQHWRAKSFQRRWITEY